MTKKIKISKDEVIKMIKEEYFRKITEIKLKNRLQQINEEINSILSEDMEDENIEEVKAGGQVSTVGPDGISKGKKWAPQFEKKGSHLVEDAGDEMPDDEMTGGGEMPGEEMPSEEIPGGDELGVDIGDEESMEGELDIDAILAKLADAIEDKIETVVDAKMNGGEESPEGGMEPDAEEIPMEEPDEKIDETQEGVVKEQDGTSIAQDQKPKNAVPFDNGKATIPKTDQLVSEATKKRMQILSGIKRNDYHDNN